MPRYQVMMPEELLATIEMVCDKYDLSRPKLIRRGIKLALDEVHQRYAVAANANQADPGYVPTPAPTLAPRALSLVEN